MSITQSTQHPSITLGYPSWWGIQIYLPGLEKSYYRGTRFDRAGVFGRITFQGKTFSEPWLDACDPLRHDNVRGPAEEFSAIGFDEAAPGGTFLKIGVGRLIRPDDAPYDHFRLYEVADEGVREQQVNRHTAAFRHILDGCYDYVKTIRISGAGQLQILHELHNTGPQRLKGDVYNHNFFTLGKNYTGPGRSVIFPYAINGWWRDEYDCILPGPGCSIDITRRIKPGESIFRGDIQSVFDERSPYEILVRGARPGGQAVRITSPTPFDRANFWANHRIACIEPFVDFDLAPGETFRQQIDYTFIPDFEAWRRAEAEAAKKKR